MTTEITWRVAVRVVGGREWAYDTFDIETYAIRRLNHYRKLSYEAHMERVTTTIERIP